jgi:hypothetical protein
MHRLYIDETGNADLKASRDPNHQFLSLTGIVMGLDYAARVAFPKLEQCDGPGCLDSFRGGTS